MKGRGGQPPTAAPGIEPERGVDPPQQQQPCSSTGGRPPAAAAGPGLVTGFPETVVHEPDPGKSFWGYSG